jgi:hypothetical protein
MKKIRSGLSLLLASLLAFSFSAFASDIDLSGYSDDELNALLESVQEEIENRNQETGVPAEAGTEASTPSTATTGDRGPSSSVDVQSLISNLAPSDALEFESNGDGTCSIAGVGGCEETDLVLPEKSPSGDTVTSVKESAFYGKKLNSLTIPNLTIELEDSAFSGCEVPTVNIYGGTVTMGSNALAYNDDLESVNIIGSTITTDDYILYHSGKDVVLTVQDSSIEGDESCFSGNACKSIIMQRCILDLGDNCLAYSDDTEDITIEDSTVAFGEYVIYNTGHHAPLTISNCTVDGKDSVFSGNAFDVINVSGSDFTLKDEAFAYSDDVKELTIADSNVNIGSYAVYNTGDDAALTITGSTVNGKDSLFSGNKFATIDIEDTTLTAGTESFAYSDGMQTVTINGGSTELGEYAFYNGDDDLIINYNGSTYNVDTIDSVFS